MRQALLSPACTHYMCRTCNRIRGLRERSDLPSALTRLPLVNFDYNPNVASTEQVPAFLAERDKPLTTKRGSELISSPRRARSARRY
jgi:hypothetical protein